MIGRDLRNGYPEGHLLPKLESLSPNVEIEELGKGQKLATPYHLHRGSDLSEVPSLERGAKESWGGCLWFCKWPRS